MSRYPSCRSLIVATTATILVSFCSSACAATIPSYLAANTKTSSPFIGVTYYQIVQSLNEPLPNPFPRELAIHIVEVNPLAPGISFLGSPGNGAAPNEYTRMTTGAFVSGNGLAVGINGDFYTTDTGATADVSGLGMSNGVVVSPPGTGGNRNSFVVTQDNIASIITSATIPTGAWNAVSGNQRLLQNGVNVTPQDSYTTTLNPHTAVGVDSDNGHVFFMVVDGRQTDYSNGMRTDEMAQLFLDFGVDDAINLDGGGSSTLVFADGFGGASRVINSPSDSATAQVPGTQRSVANHFGFTAIPNPDYIRLPSPPRPGAPTPDPIVSRLTIIDDFEGGEGRFYWDPNDSGSTRGIAAASTAVHTTSESFLGEGSQQITLVRDNSTSPAPIVRHVSGGGAPINNRILQDGIPSAMGPYGFVGFFLKTTEPDMQVSIGLDDGAASGGSVGLERSDALSVIADGKWHLYEWNLADFNIWNNFSGGNNSIDGPNAYIDSIFFHPGASTAGKTFTFYLDAVAYNPLGSLAVLATVPEPGTLVMLLPMAAMLLRRRRL